MAKIHVCSENEAIVTAKTLNRIANIIRHNCVNDLEEILLTDFLCYLRDELIIDHKGAEKP